MDGLLYEIMLDDILHDPFGTALKWQFEIADELQTRGEVPDAWEYSVGPFGPALDGDNAEWLSTLSTEQLVATGDWLDLIVSISHKNGLSY